MATRLKNILRFSSVPAGGQSTQAHNLNVDDRAVIPDKIDTSSSGNLEITADETNVTVANNGNSAVDVDVYVEHWHTIERCFGDDAVKELIPQPFVTANGQFSSIGGTTKGDGTRNVVYVRSAGDDDTGDGKTPATAYATLNRALADVPPLIWGSRWVIDITGMTIESADTITLPPVMSNDSYVTVFPGIDFDGFIAEYPLTIQAVPNIIDTIEPTDIVTNTADSVTDLQTVTVNRAYTPNEHKGRFVVSTNDFVYAAIASNTANELEICTDTAVTGPLMIVEPSAIIRSEAYNVFDIRGFDASVGLHGIDFERGGASVFSFAAGGNETVWAPFCRFEGVYIGSGNRSVALRPSVFKSGNTFQFEDGADVAESYLEGQEFSAYNAGNHSYYLQRSICDGCEAVGHSNSGEGIGYDMDNLYIRNSVGSGLRYDGGPHCSAVGVRIEDSAVYGIYAANKGTLIVVASGTGNTRYGILAGNGVQVNVREDSDITGGWGDIKCGSMAVRSWADFRSNPPVENQVDDVGDERTLTRVAW